MSEFAAVLQLSALDGADGFRISGEAAGDQSGRSVSSGDINGDGFTDLIIGARGADPNGSYSGATYVVFGGGAGFAANLNLSALDGANGFQINGEAIDDFSGRAVASAGDIDGDGFDEVMIGAFRADPNGNDSGAAYLVFGAASGFAAEIELGALDGADGFQINGAAVGDFAGVWVAKAGDVNGDGLGDFAVGASGADTNGANAGASYVVFGTAAAFPAGLELSSLDGADGFRISGESAGDVSGRRISAAGDIDGDGFDDVIVSSDLADPGGADSGAAYVVFGKAGGFAADLDLGTLDGADGFQISGVAAGDQAGIAIGSAGDVNADGFDDLIVGAYGADPNGADSGSTYIVFGKASGFTANLDLAALNGANGFRIDGATAGDTNGGAATSAGDVNGDGFDDILVGVRGADPNGSYSGATAVLFGKATGFAATLDVSTLDGDNGFIMEGAAAGDRSGFSVSSAGDVNDDGFADVIVGAWGADPNGSLSGASYVVFGHEALAAVARNGTKIANTINGGVGDDTVNGAGGNDALFGRAGNDRLNGGSGADAMAGGAGDDTYYVDNAGDTISEEAAAGGDLIVSTLSLTIGSQIEHLTLAGATGLDGIGNGTGNRITGNGAGNDLDGLGGNDTLSGAGGADILIGAAGRDQLTGGAGADRFVFAALGDLGNNAATADTVRDFATGIDTLDLNGLGMTAFIGPGAFTGAAGELRADQGATRTDVFGDVDGDAVADFLIRLTGSIALAAGDFDL